MILISYIQIIMYLYFYNCLFKYFCFSYSSTIYRFRCIQCIFCNIQRVLFAPLYARLQLQKHFVLLLCRVVLVVTDNYLLNFEAQNEIIDVKDTWQFEIILTSWLEQKSSLNSLQLHFKRTEIKCQWERGFFYSKWKQKRQHYFF